MRKYFRFSNLLVFTNISFLLFLLFPFSVIQCQQKPLPPTLKVSGDFTYDKSKKNIYLEIGSTATFMDCNDITHVAKYYIRSRYPTVTTELKLLPNVTLYCRNVDSYVQFDTIMPAHVIIQNQFFPLTSRFLCGVGENPPAFQVFCRANIYNYKKNAIDYLVDAKNYYLYDGDEVYVNCLVGSECTPYYYSESVTSIEESDIRLKYVACDYTETLSSTVTPVVWKGLNFIPILKFINRYNDTIYCHKPDIDKIIARNIKELKSLIPNTCNNSNGVYFVYDMNQLQLARYISNNEFIYFCHSRMSRITNDMHSAIVGYHDCLANNINTLSEISCKFSEPCDLRKQSCYTSTFERTYTPRPTRVYDIQAQSIIPTPGIVSIDCSAIVPNVNILSLIFQDGDGNLYYPVYYLVDDNTDTIYKDHAIFCKYVPSMERRVQRNGIFFHYLGYGEAIDLDIFYSNITIKTNLISIVPPKVVVCLPSNSLDLPIEDSELEVRRYRGRTYISLITGPFNSRIYCERNFNPCFADIEKCYITFKDSIDYYHHVSSCGDEDGYISMSIVQGELLDIIPTINPITYRCQKRDPTRKLRNYDIQLHHMGGTLYMLGFVLRQCVHGKEVTTEVFCPVDEEYLVTLAPGKTDYHLDREVGFFNCESDALVVDCDYPEISNQYHRKGSYVYSYEKSRLNFFCPVMNKIINVYCHVQVQRRKVGTRSYIRSGTVVNFQENIQDVDVFDFDRGTMVKTLLTEDYEVVCTDEVFSSTIRGSFPNELFSFVSVGQNLICRSILNKDGTEEEAQTSLFCCREGLVLVEGEVVLEPSQVALMNCNEEFTHYDFLNSYNPKPVERKVTSVTLACSISPFQIIDSSYIRLTDSNTLEVEVTSKCGEKQVFCNFKQHCGNSDTNNCLLQDTEIYYFKCQSGESVAEIITMYPSQKLYTNTNSQYVICNSKDISYGNLSDMLLVSNVYFSPIARLTCNDKITNIYCQYLDEKCLDGDQCTLGINEEVYWRHASKDTKYEIYVDGELVTKSGFEKIRCPTRFTSGLEPVIINNSVYGILVPKSDVNDVLYLCKLEAHCGDVLKQDCYLEKNTYTEVTCSQRVPYFEYTSTSRTIKVASSDKAYDPVRIFCKDYSLSSYPSVIQNIGPNDYLPLTDDISCRGVKPYRIYCKFHERKDLTEMTYLQDGELYSLYCDNLITVYFWNNEQDPLMKQNSRVDLVCNSDLVVNADSKYASLHNNLLYVQLIRPLSCRGNALSSVFCLSAPVKVTQTLDGRHYATSENLDLSCHDTSIDAFVNDFKLDSSGNYRTEKVKIDTTIPFNCEDRYSVFDASLEQVFNGKRYIPAIDLMCDSRSLTIYCSIKTDCFLTGNDCILQDRQFVTTTCNVPYTYSFVDSLGYISHARTNEMKSLECRGKVLDGQLLDSDIVVQDGKFYYYLVSPTICQHGRTKLITARCLISPYCTFSESESCYLPLSMAYAHATVTSGINVKVYSLSGDNVTYNQYQVDTDIICDKTITKRLLSTHVTEVLDGKYYYVKAEIMVPTGGGKLYCPFTNVYILNKEKIYAKTNDTIVIHLDAPVAIFLDTENTLNLQEYVYICDTERLVNIPLDRRVIHESKTYGVIVEPRDGGANGQTIGGLYCLLPRSCTDESKTTCVLDLSSYILVTCDTITKYRYDTMGSPIVFHTSENQFSCDIELLKYASDDYVILSNNIIHVLAATYSNCNNELVSVYCSLETNYRVFGKTEVFAKTGEKIGITCRETAEYEAFYRIIMGSALTDRIVTCENIPKSVQRDVMMTKDNKIYARVLQPFTCSINDPDVVPSRDPVSVYCIVDEGCSNLNSNCILESDEWTTAGCVTEEGSFMMYTYHDRNADFVSTTYHVNEVNIICDASKHTIVEGSYLSDVQPVSNGLKYLGLKLAEAQSCFNSNSNSDIFIYCQLYPAKLIQSTDEVLHYSLNSETVAYYFEALPSPCNSFYMFDMFDSNKHTIQQLPLDAPFYISCSNINFRNYPTQLMEFSDNTVQFRITNNNYCGPDRDLFYITCEKETASIMDIITVNSTDQIIVAPFTLIKIGEYFADMLLHTINYNTGSVSPIENKQVFCPERPYFSTNFFTLSYTSGKYHYSVLNHGVVSNFVHCEYKPKCNVATATGDCVLRRGDQAVIHCPTDTAYIQLNNLKDNRVLTRTSGDAILFSCNYDQFSAPEPTIEKQQVTFNDNTQGLAYVILKQITCRGYTISVYCEAIDVADYGPVF